MLSEKQRLIYSIISKLEKLDKFPLSILPHLGLFIVGEKTVCRFVLETQVAQEILDVVRKQGLFGNLTPIKSQPMGDHWNSFERVNGVSYESMLVISNNEENAIEFRQCELDGDSSKAGKLLGYPGCCVDKYAELSLNSANWYLELLNENTTDPNVSKWCNRLASLWGGTCPTGELFPCSLVCEQAQDLGRESDKCLRELGLHQLADEILKQATREIYLLDNEIVIGDVDIASALPIRISN